MNTFHYQVFENTTIKRCFLFPILLHNMEMDIHGLCPIQQNRHLQLSRSMEQGSQMSVVDFIHHNAYFVSMRPSEVYFHPSEFILLLLSFILNSWRETDAFKFSAPGCC